MKFGRNFKSPKIICTLGTTTDDADILKEMIKEGMRCARINTAYTDTKRYKERIDLLRSIEKIPVILDLKGSQIRISTEDKYRIAVGMEFPVGFQKGSIAFNHDFFDEIFPGDRVLFENGTIKTVVAEKKNHYLVLKIIEAGEGYLTNHMGVNVPGRIFRNILSLTQRDVEIIHFALEERVEFIAISFARSVEDVFNLKKAMEGAEKNKSNQPGIIIKIEDPVGVDNLEKIIRDTKTQGIELAVMIGRGDLFVESPQIQLPFIQKKIINTCDGLETPVIVATGLLESMQYNPYPTRSEVCDTANAILDGADWLMLSGETSNSRYPVEAVRMLSDIIKESQNHFKK